MCKTGWSFGLEENRVKIYQPFPSFYHWEMIRFLRYVYMHTYMWSYCMGPRQIMGCWPAQQRFKSATFRYKPHLFAVFLSVDPTSSSLVFQSPALFARNWLGLFFIKKKITNRFPCACVCVCLYIFHVSHFICSKTDCNIECWERCLHEYSADSISHGDSRIMSKSYQKKNKEVIGSLFVPWNLGWSHVTTTTMFPFIVPVLIFVVTFIMKS